MSRFVAAGQEHTMPTIGTKTQTTSTSALERPHSTDLADTRLAAEHEHRLASETPPPTENFRHDVVAEHGPYDFDGIEPEIAQ